MIIISLFQCSKSQEAIVNPEADKLQLPQETYDKLMKEWNELMEKLNKMMDELAQHEKLARKKLHKNRIHVHKSHTKTGADGQTETTAKEVNADEIFELLSDFEEAKRELLTLGKNHSGFGEAVRKLNEGILVLERTLNQDDKEIEVFVKEMRKESAVLAADAAGAE